jgi:hypothetical protein
MPVKWMRIVPRLKELSAGFDRLSAAVKTRATMGSFAAAPTMEIKLGLMLSQKLPNGVAS